MNDRYYAGKDICEVITELFEHIGAMPAADVAEVVRCKDCEFNDDGYSCPFREAGWGYDPDRYCSFGERKEADND